LFAGAVNPIIAPDGGRVAFISLQGGMQTPWVATLDGGEPVEVIRAFAGVGSLAFSPDGQQLLFASSTGPVVCDLPACARRRDFRTPPMHPDMPVLRWTPDGEGIAYVDQSGANI